MKTTKYAQSRKSETWWILKDISAVLGIKNNRDISRRLRKDEISYVVLNDISSNGVKQNRNFKLVNEPGLYKVVLKSDKPNAIKFQDWITHEVIPSIRKYGAYISKEKLHGLSIENALSIINALQKKSSNYHSKSKKTNQKY